MPRSALDELSRARLARILWKTTLKIATLTSELADVPAPAGRPAALTTEWARWHRLRARAAAATRRDS